MSSRDPNRIRGKIADEAAGGAEIAAAVPSRLRPGFAKASAFRSAGGKVPQDPADMAMACICIMSAISPMT